MFSLVRSSLTKNYNGAKTMTMSFCTSSRMNKRLEGKVAIVTASTEGIGYAIADRLGSEGAHIVVSSRRSKNVDKAVEQLKANGHSVLGMECHVSKADDRQKLIEKTIEKFGQIDILVSNAAVNPTMGGVLECSEPAWDKIFEVNVKNALQLSQLVAPHMQKRQTGTIVYVSSIAGYYPMPLLGAYSVSKTTLIGLTKAVAMELGSDNIRVNCIAPGIIETKFSAPLTQSDMVKEKIIEPTALGRIGQPMEIAGTVAFMVSEDASYMTGETIVVAGGMHARL